MGEEVYLKVQIQKPRPEHVRTLTATPMTVKASQAGKEEVKLTASFEAGYCLDYFTVTEREGSAKKIEGNSFRFEKSVVVGVVAKRSVTPVTSVAVTPATATIDVNGTVSLTATVMPSDATKKGVSWSSSNPSVATVDENGKVTGKKAGSVTVIATAQDGSKVSGSGAVTVKNPVTSVEVLPKSATLKMSAKVELSAKVSPDKATKKDVTWSSSNPSVATVDENGMVTGKNAGEVTITAKVDGKEGRSTVTVVSEYDAAKAEVDRLFKDYENKARDELKKYESTVSKSKRDEIEQYAKSIKKKLIFNASLVSPSAKGVSSKFSISSLGISGISIQCKLLEVSGSGMVVTEFRTIKQAAFKVNTPFAVKRGVVARLIAKTKSKIAQATAERDRVSLVVNKAEIEKCANELMTNN